MDVHLFPAYESGGGVGYNLVLKHAEDTDWPYELSHNPPAWDPALSAHHQLIWGPGKVTQSDVPAGFHESLLRILDAWWVFYEDLQEIHILSSDAQRANSAMKSTKEPHQRCAECTPTRCQNGAAEEERR
jgi:hypothetical protein